MQLFVGAKGLVVHDGKILLLRESNKYDEGTASGRWDVPGGRIEPDEKVRDGLIREVHEESGLKVKPDALLGIYDGFPEIRGEVCHVVRVYFLAYASSGNVVLSEDHDLFEWVIPEKVKEKQLVDDIEEVTERYIRNIAGTIHS